ncbi:MAG: hypothetical protein PVG65_04200 [Candidatus Thorarchaeota archaeon]|jgi:hypothetical protein
MAKKKVSYKNILKEAIAEFDTSKTTEVKGPMLDPVLSWEGGGELPTHKDAASILERYYFNEDKDELVEVEEAEYNDDGKPDSGKTMKHDKGAGTEQAGTSDGKMDKREEEIAKEDEDITEQDEEMKDEEEEEKEEVEEDEELTEDVEKAVIEKLIEEMEEEEDEEEEEEGAEEVKEQDKMEDEEEEEEEEVEEMDTMAGKKSFKGPKPGTEAPKEKEQKDTEQDAQGAGTQQAGTGDAEGQVPDRKDVADKFVKAKQYNESEEVNEQDEEAADKDKKDDEEEELDVDKEIKEQSPGSGTGHVPPPSVQKKMKKGDQGEDYDLDEAFKIFTEEIDEEDE